MIFLHVLSWIALVIQLLMVTLATAAGLYYLAELVEEYTVMAKKLINVLIIATTVVYVGIFFFEDFTWLMVAGGLASCVSHFFILQSFPYFFVSSPSFISAVALVFLNHYLAFSFFSSNWYPFAEVLAYFTICLWLVPFTFFVSLSANENVLPTTSGNHEADDADVVSNYLRTNKKKSWLLTFFKGAQESILPQRSRKHF